jgi:cyanate lyase
MSNSYQAAKSLVELITRQQAALEITDQVIADALGYKSVNVVTQIKSGQIKLPMSKVRALADLLEVERGDVMQALKIAWGR